MKMKEIQPVPLRNSEPSELTKPGFLDALISLRRDCILGKN